MNRNDKEYIISKIRSQYTEKETDSLSELKAMDAKVKRPANIFAYILGSVGAVVMGAGMSLVMTDIGEMIGMSSTMLPGVAVGAAGLVLVIINYPTYKKLLAARRKKYAQKIIELSDKIIKA